MIDQLEPYPAIKDSGVQWLGEVPEHWEVRRLRQVLRRVTERNRPDLPLLSVVRDKGVILRDTTGKSENHNFIPDDLSNYKVVRAGQFAMNKMKAWQGSYGVSVHDGIVSPAYFVFDLAGIDGAFFHAAIRSRAYVPSFAHASDGVRIGQWDLAEPRMREIPFLVPSLPEQAAIARFLDYADRRIRRYIRAKRKLIELLEEQKQAIIHRAVTRGLDPDVRLKPSGVEWLGEVPEHWRVVPIKRAFLSMEYGVSESAADHGTIRLLTMAHIRDGRVSIPNEGGVRSVNRALLLHPGDLLFNRTNSAELVGKVGLFKSTSEVVTFASYLVRMRPRAENDAEYLNFLLNNRGLLREARREAIPSLHQANLNPTRYGRLTVPLPPLSEQIEIVRALHESTRSPEDASCRTQREIDLVREYRTRLIADVVTGKLDIREAAAQLSEETETFDEADDSPGAEDATAADLDAIAEGDAA